MHQSVSGEQRHTFQMRLLAFLFAEIVVLGFAVSGPEKPLGMAMIAVPMILIVLAVPRLPVALILPILGLSILTPQIVPGVHLYDFIAIPLGALAVLVTFLHEDRRVWDVNMPGIFCVIALAIPLIAFFMRPVALPSYLGAYKTIVVWVCIFVALRRLVRPEISNLLLWIFPLLGSVASIQVLLRIRDVGGLIFSRMDYRTFYTGVGWGSSNYVAALILVCLLGSVLLFILDRRLVPRVALAGCAVLMTQTFVVLFSRGATVGLAVAGLVLILGWRGRQSLIVLGLVSIMGVFFAVSTAGQVILQRFTDPREYASWAQRLEIWQSAWERFLRYPYTGIGLNQGRYEGDGLGDAQAHNFILNALGEQGILGGLLYVAIMVTAYRLVFRARPAGVEGPLRPVRMVLLAMITAIIVHGMVEPTVTGYHVGVLFVWLMAWLTLQDVSASRSESAPATPAHG